MTFYMPQTITIVATAAYPWRTGTAILALFRALFLAKRGMDVRLYLPWLPPEEQEQIFGEGVRFESSDTQEACIRSYLPEDCPSFSMEFYPATYIVSWGSILPICRLPDKIRCSDWLILEEPEHLTWKNPWKRFRKKAPRITGIVMTNYYFYWRSGLPKIPFVAGILECYNRLLIRRHCDDVIFLGTIFPVLPHSRSLNVSGIHPSFFQSGEAKEVSTPIYFIGKLMWEKGFRELIDRLSVSGIRGIDIYGIGKDRDPIDAYARGRGVTFCFKGNTADPARDVRGYKIFINASRSEAICTTTAEALGQGKFVIIPAMAGNDAFYGFKNCLTYSSFEEFGRKLEYAMTHAPEPDPQVEALTWEAATGRLLHYYQETTGESKP